MAITLQPPPVRSLGWSSGGLPPLLQASSFLASTAKEVMPPSCISPTRACSGTVILVSRSLTMWRLRIFCPSFSTTKASISGDTMKHNQLHGNSHMMMQDKNNLQVADLILAWIHEHVE